MKGILFLCTGNACRSQMAEGFARRMLSPQIAVFSAGTKPAGQNPRALAAMAKVGLDISSQHSKHVDEIDFTKISLVITLCGDAAETCPTVPGAITEHWGLPDPAAVKGSEAKIEIAFNAVRDDIAGRVAALAARYRPEACAAVVGGSGFYDLPGVEDLRELRVDTPFGAPSDALFVGRLGGKKVVFLPRHGRGHTLLPHEINMRANIYALKRLGVTKIISVSAVGSLREEIAPGDVVLPRQFIDRAVHRAHTFFGEGVVAHVSLADPVCNGLASSLAEKAGHEPGRVHDGGTYLNMQGPQFSTRAESHLYRQWGCDIIGMTNGTEARLAREAEICYATLAFPTDYDCWRTATEEVSIEQIVGVLRANVAKGQRIVAAAVQAIDPGAACSCRTTLDMGLMTPPEAIGAAARLRLHAILARRLAPAEKLGV